MFYFVVDDVPKKIALGGAVVAQAFFPSTQEAEVGSSLNSGLASSQSEF